jgi:HEAT repeat protein
MKQTTVFALHLARLLSQLMEDPGNHDAHRGTVDELLGSSTSSVTLAWDNWQVLVDGEALATSLPGVKDLVSRMAAHSIREIAIAANAEPGHVLGAIWILAREPLIGDGGTNAIRRLAKLGAGTVIFVPVVPLAASSSAYNVAANYTPALGTESHSAAASLPISTYNFDLYAQGPPTAADLDPGLQPVDPSADEELFRELRSIDVGAKPDELIASLRRATRLMDLRATLDRLGNLIIAAQTQEKHHDAALLLYEVIQSEAQVGNAELKHEFKLTLTRVGQPGFFRALAGSMSRVAEQRVKYITVFGRYGDEAVEALIEQLAYAELAKERRILFDAIVQLRRGVPMLVQMLDDKRWYVARNAAELLGEMCATEGEAGLVRALRHDDHRVRRSAAAALAKMGSRGAVSALRAAMLDASPNVRMQATIAVATRKDPNSTPLFIRALSDEKDPEVQRALLSALGKLGSTDAVKRLISDAEPDGRFFRRKATPIRVAAVQALAEAGTPEALAALEHLTKDRSRGVREAAIKALTERENPFTAAAQRG